MEFSLTPRPVLMQHGAQGYGAFPKFSKSIVRVICFLGISYITSSLTQQGFHRQMTQYVPSFLIAIIRVKQRDWG